MKSLYNKTTESYYTSKQVYYRKTNLYLTKEKCAQIESLLRQGLPKTTIIKAVGIARSTLYLEIDRGTVEQLG